MKVVLDLSQLLEDGEITQAEADKLKRLSKKSTGSLAFNVLIGFGVIAVAVGAIALVPDATTGIVLGAIVLGFGLALLHRSPMEWGVLANICIILGALGLGGGVVFMTNGSLWGDRLEQLTDVLGRTKDNVLTIPRLYFVIGWALALIAFAVWAMKNDRRWVVNVCTVFGAIHFYTQFFERLGPNPLAILLGGVSALGIAIAIWQFNKKAVAKPV